jgi:hypothetical protein
MGYTGYPRQKINTFLPQTAPNTDYGAEALYPDSLKIDGAQSVVPIVGGNYADAELANGATITDALLAQVGRDVSRYGFLRGTVRSDKAVTLTVWQNPVRYNGALHWLFKTEVSITASVAQGGGVDIGAIQLKGGRMRVTVTNAGTATTDLARIFPALYLSKD